MFWDKKEEKDRLPDLPEMKTRNSNILPQYTTKLDDDEDLITEKHSLPSFPDSASQRGFSQAAIKDAITTTPFDDDEEPIRLNPRKFKAVEMEENLPEMSSLRVEKQVIEEEPRYTKVVPAIPIAPSLPQRIDKFSGNLERFPDPKRDIFVKIDKFYSAKKALEAINLKLTEVDDLLKKIRETKLREEQELIYWEKEMASIKSRVKDVTENIFEKIE